MKVIFLDFDGVVNDDHHHMIDVYIGKKYMGFYSKIFICRLNKIIEETGAQIVLSSTWRLDESNENLELLLKNMGIIGTLHGSTCHLVGKIRGKEIKQYLKEHKDITKYCIIDDESDMTFWQKSKLVHTDGYLGIQPRDVDRAIHLLGYKDELRKY